MKFNSPNLFWPTALLCFLSLSPNSSPAAVAGLEADLEAEPLPPDQAFVLSTNATAMDMIRAQWYIVDGYYMYRQKFKFESATTGISLGDGIYPKGKIKEDEFFGQVETYRGDISIDIPVIRTDEIQQLELTITSQGCADIGICYPPQKQNITLQLPPLVKTAAAATVEARSEASGDKGFNPLSALKQLGDSLGLSADEEKFLPPDQAFVFSAEVANGNVVNALWNIKEGYYLYRDKFAFDLVDSQGVSIGQVTMPPGQEKVDESFGKMVVYHNDVRVQLPLERSALEPTNITLIAKYQGCSEAGFCYPPQEKSMPLSLPAGQAKPVGLMEAGRPAAAISGKQPIISEQDRIANSLASGNVLLTIVSFFGFGLLLAFTPCVFPMVPILSSIIIGQGEKITTRKAFAMSSVYVLAMALTYTIAGVIAGLFGQNLQAAFQNPWVLSTFSAVFVGLAMSMFGFYELQMPNFIQSRLTEISNRQQGGTLLGVAIMGFLSALIVGPCVAAPLAGALIYIGQTGDATLGGMALFALSLGMGAPLLAIGTSAGKLLPKAGGWMDAVKAVFGVMMLAVAIWMLERILPASLSLALWAVLFIVSAIYMGALEPLPIESTGWRKLWKGLGIVSLVYGALLLIGVASGGRDMFQPLQGMVMAGSTGAGAGAQQQHALEFKQVKGLPELEHELTRASSSGKLAMLDLYADWCVSCKEMEKYTFSHPNVQQVLSDVVLLQADVTANDEMDKALLKKYGLIGPPSILFFDKTGAEKRSYRLVGFLDADKFVSHVATMKQ